MISTTSWYRLGPSGTPFYVSSGEWGLPQALAATIIRAFISMIVLSTCNIVFPIFNIGGVVPAWVCYSINLTWIVTCSISICLLARFRVVAGGYDPSVCLFALVMMVGWLSLTVINLTFMSTATARCYLESPEANDLTYCGLLGIGDVEVKQPLLMRIFHGRWSLFSWFMMALMLLVSWMQGFDWMVQHRRIKRMVMLTDEITNSREPEMQ